MNAPPPRRRPRTRRAAAVVRTLWPHQPGTIKLARRFGAALVCVRHRRDATGWTRLTTVELIVEEVDVRPRVVAVALPWDADPARRAELRAAGARWDGRTRLWKMPIGVARGLGLAPPEEDAVTREPAARDGRDSRGRKR